MSEGPEMILSDGQANMWKQNRTELEDVEMKAENTAMESYSSTWTDGSVEPEPFRDSHFHFDVVKNGKIGNKFLFFCLTKMSYSVFSL